MAKTLEERKTGAIIGSAVADAASQPLHWVYDTSQLEKLGDEIEFYSPPLNPFYHIENGKPSSYGSQAFVLLESLVECKGFNVEDFTNRTYKHFGPDSDFSHKTPGVEDPFPFKHGYRNGSIRTFLKNVEAGKKETGSEADSQIDCVAKIACIVALYAGRPEMLDKVEEAIRVTQNSDFPVVCGLAGARILEKYILNDSKESPIEDTIADLKSSKRANPQELDNSVVAQLKDVLNAKDLTHKEAVSRKFASS